MRVTHQTYIFLKKIDVKTKFIALLCISIVKEVQN